MGGVFLQNFTGYKELTNWTITGYPLTNYVHIKDVLLNPGQISLPKNGFLDDGPVIFKGTFSVPHNEIHDTYWNTTGWGKVI